MGSFIRSEQGNIINHTTVKRRLPDLFEHKCVNVNRQRGNANEISVHLPSDIPACRTLIDREEQEAQVTPEKKDERDYYTDPNRRLVVLGPRRKRLCVLYCLPFLRTTSSLTISYRSQRAERTESTTLSLRARCVTGGVAIRTRLSS